MDGGAEKRVAPSGGGGGSGLDKTLNNRIMLRFRPIAPKPIAGGPLLDHRSTMILSGKRPRRKYVRVRRNSRRCRHTTNPCDELQKQERSENAVVTRELGMENIQLGEGSVAFSGCNSVNIDPTAGKIEIHDNQVKVHFREAIDRTVRVVDTWVTVESMTGTCMMDLGRTDDEKVVNLGRDTCPAFISDGLNRLRWVNEAYRKMVAWQEEEAEEPSLEIMVWLKIEDMEVYSQTAFSCKIKLEYRKENNGKCTKVVPCDAWKMDAGGFAWRLDVKAALSLGL